jgi:ATP/maltotriose-dependent transcriptional regulator MalT/DNA-binding SARP family transcriptional activator
MEESSMGSRNTGLAKTTRPRISGVLARERLFERLEEASRRPVVWLTGPPGCGKTTLVANYMDERDLDGLWYQVDAGEADVATFFYYMGMAAEAVAESETALPRLAPEYTGDLAAFSRGYFRELFSRLPSPFVLVFDNYQDVPPHSRFHEVIREGLAEISDGSTVVFISRSDPPATLARYRVSQALVVIDWDELRLTREETDDMVDMRLPQLDEAGRESLYERTQGWAAGLVLMIENLSRGKSLSSPVAGGAPQAIFDYLAGEIFEDFDDEAAGFLVRTALLPQMTVAEAMAMADDDEAGERLTDLVSRYYLVDAREVGGETVFQYHPLLRDFLLAQGRKRMGVEEQADLRGRAAELLEAGGRAEDTVTLLVENHDWTRLGSIIRQQAADLVDQGRAETLEQWLESMPPDRLSDDPWLLYWLGICRLSTAPRESRRLCARAFDRFSESRPADVAGLYSACAGVMEAILYDLDDLTQADRWLEEVAKLQEAYPEFPTEKIEARITCNTFMILVLRQPSHPDIESWGERTALVAQRQTDPNLRLLMDQETAVALMWTGQFPQAVQLIDRMRLLAQSPQVSPLGLTTLRYVESMYYMLVGDRDACLEAVYDGLDVAARSGVHIWNNGMRVHGVGGALAEGDLESAHTLLQQLEADPGHSRRYELCLLNYFAAWYAMLERDAVTAFHRLKTSERLAKEIGVPTFEFICRLALVQVLLECGDRSKAVRYMRGLRSGVSSIKNRFLEFLGMMTYANAALEHGRPKTGLKALGYAMGLGREKGFTHSLWWQPAVMARLCVRALQEGIETEYARSLIRQRDLVPDEPPLNIEGWPWAFRIYTLGQFQVLRNDVPHAASGKSQSRPLELLQALVAYGGRDVGVEKITDALWPRIDSDYAHKSFTTTLHRLRKTLGEDRALILKDGRLGLDERFVWFDTSALEQACAEVDRYARSDDETLDERTARALAERIMDLYQGPFLGDRGERPWALGAREQLRARLLRAVGALGNYFEQIGKWRRAADLYERGLESDPLAESLYRRLMQCHQRQGRTAEAIETFNRCRRVLKAELDVEPSEETRDLYARLTA